jgi:hypothetical protein
VNITFLRHCDARRYGMTASMGVMSKCFTMRIAERRSAAGVAVANQSALRPPASRVSATEGRPPVHATYSSNNFEDGSAAITFALWLSV